MLLKCWSAPCRRTCMTPSALSDLTELIPFRSGLHVFRMMKQAIEELEARLATRHAKLRPLRGFFSIESSRVFRPVHSYGRNFAILDAVDPTLVRLFRNNLRPSFLRSTPAS